MAAVTIKLVNVEKMFEFYGANQPKSLARKLLADGQYRVYGTMGVPDLKGELAAEEVFDLTNNPSRQEEREYLYGLARSVSVGDIVNVDGEDFVCLNVGWEKL